MMIFVVIFSRHPLSNVTVPRQLYRIFSSIWIFHCGISVLLEMTVILVICQVIVFHGGIMVFTVAVSQFCLQRQLLLPDSSAASTILNVLRFIQNESSVVFLFALILDCCLAFALVCRDCTQLKEKLYSFTLDTDDVSKEEILTTICKNLAIVICRPDIVSLITSVNFVVCMGLSVVV